MKYNSIPPQNEKGISDKGNGRRRFGDPSPLMRFGKGRDGKLALEGMKMETNRTIFVSLCITTNSGYYYYIKLNPQFTGSAVEKLLFYDSQLCKLLD